MGDGGMGFWGGGSFEEEGGGFVCGVYVLLTIGWGFLSWFFFLHFFFFLFGRGGLYLRISFPAFCPFSFLSLFCLFSFPDEMRLPPP